MSRHLMSSALNYAAICRLLPLRVARVRQCAPARRPTTFDIVIIVVIIVVVVVDVATLSTLFSLPCFARSATSVRIDAR